MVSRMQVQAAARALAVMVMDKRIRGWLQASDPKALEQAASALVGLVKGDPADPLNGPYSTAVLAIRPRWRDAVALMEPECELDEAVFPLWKEGAFIGPWDSLMEIRDGLANALSVDEALDEDDVACVYAVP